MMREVLFSFNYMWFLMYEWAKKNCTEKIEGEEFQNLSEEFGRYEAQRLEKSGLRLRKGFFSCVIPTARAERLFTPPHERPAGVPSEAACEWIISI